MEDIDILEIAKKNNKKFNFTKLAEELFELGELCMKSVNKQPQHRPSKEKLAEELGDVLIRAEMLIEAEDLNELVNARLEYKEGKIIEYYVSGKYGKGV